MLEISSARCRFHSLMVTKGRHNRPNHFGGSGPNRIYGTLLAYFDMWCCVFVWFLTWEPLWTLNWYLIRKSHQNKHDRQQTKPEGARRQCEESIQRLAYFGNKSSLAVAGCSCLFGAPAVAQPTPLSPLFHQLLVCSYKSKTHFSAKKLLPLCYPAWRRLCESKCQTPPNGQKN